MGCFFFRKVVYSILLYHYHPFQNQNKNKTEVIVLPTDDVYLNFKNGAE